MGKIFKLFFLIVALTLILLHKLKNSNNFEKFSHQFRIDRDQLGIPHIISKSKMGIIFGQGYAVAQDRLWSLYISKMIVQGRLAEALGNGALALDIHTRNFNYMSYGAKIITDIDQESLQHLQAFCDGINTYVKNSKLLPFQFYLFWLNWQQLQPKHIVSQIIMYGFFLQFEWMHELARQRLLETVGFDLAVEMLAFGSQNMYSNRTIIDDEQLKKLGLFEQYNITNQRAILKQHWVDKNLSLGSINMPSGNRYKTSGSNAWAIHGNHTESGKSIIANDPHLALLLPSTFYISEWILINDKNDIQNQVFGASIYNIPTFASGIRKNYTAWGITASYSDNKDIFLQTTRFNEKQEFEYFYEGEWKKFTSRKQIFKVRGQEDFEQTYYENHRGPVLEGIFKDLTTKYGFPFNEKYNKNQTITLASVLFKLDPKLLKCFLAIPFTKTFQESDINFKKSQLPHTDAVVLDTHNNIFVGRTGAQVYRKIPQMGSFIKDGRYSLYEMGPIVPAQQKLAISNPKKGYAALTNIKFASDNYKCRSTMHQIANGRSQRLNKIFEQKMVKKQKFTMEDMKAMQLDFVDQFVRMTLPGLLSALENVRILWTSPKAQKIMEKLKIWNANMLPNSTQASFYHVWERLFQKSLLTFTELNQRQRQAIINHAYFEVYQFKLFQKIAKNSLTQKQWIVCANQLNQNLTNVHPCLFNAAQAFKNLPSQLQELFGHGNLQQYQWSKIHQHNWMSIPFSQIPILRNIWGRSSPTGGNSRTLNVAILSHQRSSGYNSFAGATWRFITDLNTTYFSLDTGQSGSIFSPFYDNFVGKDEYFEYVARNPFKQDIKNWKTVVNSL